MLSAQNYSAIIGPQCSHTCSQVARLATYLNLPCFSGVCQDVDMGNKKEFKVLIKLTQYAIIIENENVYLHKMQHFLYNT